MSFRVLFKFAMDILPGIESVFIKTCSTEYGFVHGEVNPSCQYIFCSGYGCHKYGSDSMFFTCLYALEGIMHRDLKRRSLKN